MGVLDLFSLEGKVALVTGAGRGLGQAMALGLAEAGADIAGLYRANYAETQTRVKKQREHFEIRYLPLSEHYRLSRPDGDDTETFPRLRHVLAELGDLRIEVETGALPRGEYELLARSYLDKQKMPPPMRLPVLFSPRWSHESAWTSWPMDIEPEV